MKGTEHMFSRLGKRSRIILGSAVTAIVILGATLASFHATPQAAKAAPLSAPLCKANPAICTETLDPWSYDGTYTGHDEPSVLFYSSTPGSGNSNLYRVTLPTQPGTKPAQDGSGSTWDFQLHPAFWFGMAMCDNQSGPNPNGSPLAGSNVPCTPDSDANIFTGTTPGAPDYIGKHPGVAFMEMQFYPPGWVPWQFATSCSPDQWCAAMTIDQLSQNQNIAGTGGINNPACLSTVGIEPVNLAFITRTGVAQGPANPVDATSATYVPTPSKDLMMSGGDQLTVDMHDTSAGFQVVIHDLTSGQSGSMTASSANGFGHVIFDPSASTCTTDHAAFHPAYSTSSENTRVIWAAHSYNVAYSDEIGHFEYCNAVNHQGGRCTSAGVNDTSGVDGDDGGCFAPPFQAPFVPTSVKVGGCLGTDGDFDGVGYQPSAWPGNGNDANAPTPISFSSPLFNGTTNYDRLAFETDLPRIEVFNNPSTNNHCNRTTGANCVNPPVGANFYPFFNANTSGGQCVWYEGGGGTPHNTYDGVNSTTEFGPLSFIDYPVPTGISTRTNDFRNVLSSNPCPA
jgi:hypothetical protein